MHSQNSVRHSQLSNTVTDGGEECSGGGCLEGLFQSLARPTHGTARLLCARGMTKEHMRGACGRLQLPRDMHMQVAMAIPKPSSMDHDAFLRSRRFCPR